MVYNWHKKIQMMAYPAVCTLCGAAGDNGVDLCCGCRDDLPFNRHACQQCALPLPDAAPEDALCGQCQRASPRFDHGYIPLRYAYPLDHLISNFKFRGKLAEGRLLSGLVGDFLVQQRCELPELIIPVPLHASRLRERGFNQALELARPLAKRFGLPVDSQMVVRNRATSSQMELSKKARRKNVRGAFELTRQLQAQHVAIMDDVVTTGSTVNELAAVLRRGGAGRVDVWAVARRADNL